MPGPRKNLTPLDMQMLGLAYNQGGVINFLGKQPEVTAPVRAQSHADSPSVQLAYITDAEKDLLVDANIHGSMDGKPNPGPAGLESLDDFFNVPGGGIGGGSTSNTGGSVGGGGSQGGGSSAEDYGIQSGQAVGSGGKVWEKDDSAPDKPGGWQQVSTAEQQAAQLQAQIAQEKAAVEAAKKAAAAKAAAAAKLKEENRKRGILSKLGHGEVLDDYIGDTAWKDKYNTGQHKLRSQYDRLLAKYGPGFADTTQGKLLANYLSGVAVERGGGLGARDATYGGGPTENIDSKLEKQRQELLAQISGMGTPFGGQDIGTILADVERMGIGKDLTPEQYFNFRQQLMSADPTPGNMSYKKAFPWSSGYAASKFATPVLSMAKGALGIEDKPPQEWEDWAMNERTFYDTSMPSIRHGDQMDRREPSWWNANTEAQPVEDEDEAATDVTNDLTPTPIPYPFPTYGTGIAGLDWASLAPQFGPQYPGHYSNQGIQPNFANWYDNLNKYYGYS